MGDRRPDVKNLTGDLFEDSDSDEQSQDIPIPQQLEQKNLQSDLKDLEEDKGEDEMIKKKEQMIASTSSTVKIIDQKTLEKMQAIEGTIGEYRSKLAQLERILKEEDDINEDPDKREEIEKLRDQLKEHMIVQLNELKFLQNQQVIINRKSHLGRVCEAYYDQEKTWYAAIVLDVFEDEQEVEVAWIGYKMQARTPKKFVNILTPVDAQDLFEGAQCNAVNSADGMWYPCIIEKVLNEERSSNDVSAELGAILSKYLIKFKHNQQKSTIPLDCIRVTRDQQAQNLRKKEQIELGFSGDGDIGNLEDFQIPDHLRLKRGEPEKVKLQKKKKVKALKYQYKVKQQEIESKSRQSTWLDFTNKAQGQKAGHFAFKQNTESIFKSPDNVMGRVGVVGSGKEMTSYETINLKDVQALGKGKPDIFGQEVKYTQQKRPKYQ